MLTCTHKKFFNWQHPMFCIICFGYVCGWGQREGGKKKNPFCGQQGARTVLAHLDRMGRRERIHSGEKTEIIHRALFLPKYSPPSRCGEYKLFQNCYHALCDLGLTWAKRQSKKGDSVARGELVRLTAELSDHRSTDMQKLIQSGV